MSNNPDQTSSFVDLAAFENINATTPSMSSSIIKSAAVRNAGVSKIEILDGDHDAPNIHIQREGDKVRRIEFICSCGKSTSLDLEYEEE